MLASSSVDGGVVLTAVLAAAHLRQIGESAFGFCSSCSAMWNLPCVSIPCVCQSGPYYLEYTSVLANTYIDISGGHISREPALFEGRDVPDINHREIGVPRYQIPLSDAGLPGPRSSRTCHARLRRAEWRPSRCRDVGRVWSTEHARWPGPRTSGRRPALRG